MNIGGPDCSTPSDCPLLPPPTTIASTHPRTFSIQYPCTQMICPAHIHNPPLAARREIRSPPRTQFPFFTGGGRLHGPSPCSVAGPVEGLPQHPPVNSFHLCTPTISPYTNLRRITRLRAGHIRRQLGSISLCQSPTVNTRGNGSCRAVHRHQHPSTRSLATLTHHPPPHTLHQLVLSGESTSGKRFTHTLELQLRPSILSSISHNFQPVRPSKQAGGLMGVGGAGGRGGGYHMPEMEGQ